MVIAGAEHPSRGVMQCFHKGFFRANEKNQSINLLPEWRGGGV